jgi:hypothetical protein
MARFSSGRDRSGRARRVGGSGRLQFRRHQRRIERGGRVAARDVSGQPAIRDLPRAPLAMASSGLTRRPPAIARLRDPRVRERACPVGKPSLG